MNPINIRFVVTINSNDRDFDKYSGVNKLNEVFIQGWDDTKSPGWLSYAEQQLIPTYDKKIKSLFLEDFKKQTIEFEKVEYNISDLKHGRTAIPYSPGESFQYDVAIKLTSVVYTCVEIISDKNIYICHRGSGTPIQDIYCAISPIVE